MLTVVIGSYRPGPAVPALGGVGSHVAPRRRTWAAHGTDLAWAAGTGPQAGVRAGLGLVRGQGLGGNVGDKGSGRSNCMARTRFVPG